MNKTFFEFNTLLDDFYCFVLNPSTRYEESKPAVKEVVLNQAGNLCKFIESTGTVSKIATEKPLDFSNVWLACFATESAGNGTAPALSWISQIIFEIALDD